jgi:hypothetical protein
MATFGIHMNLKDRTFKNNSLRKRAKPALVISLRACL